MKKSNYISELTFLGFLLLIAIAFAVQLIEPENDPLQVVDSVEYARVIIGLFLLSILIVMGQTLKKFRDYLKTEQPEETTGQECATSNKLVLWLVVATGIVFFFYCFCMQRIGYYTSGLIMLLVYQSILYKAQNGKLDKKGMIKIVAISVGVTVALYLVFSVAFELYLPRGILI